MMSSNRRRSVELVRTSRRNFLGQVVAGSASVVAWPLWARTAPKTQRSTVGLVENPGVVVPDIGIRSNVLAEMLQEGLCAATNKSSAAEVWRTIVGKDQKVLLKFNSALAKQIGTNEAMARTLIASLLSAGIKPEQIVLMEASVDAPFSAKLTKPAWGWTDKAYDFGSGKEQLTKAIDQVTAIVNVPFLKAHRLAGMSGCLKNLSHGLIRRPGRYHANQCSPYIADIVAMPAIRKKVRLHVVNALRVVYDAGTFSAKDAIDTGNCLIVSTDPVAADTVGQDILDTLRIQKGLKPIAEEPGLLRQHVLAAKKGLGSNDFGNIRVQRPRPF